MGRGGPCSWGGGRGLGNRSNSGASEELPPGVKGVQKRLAPSAGSRLSLNSSSSKLLYSAAVLERSIQNGIDEIRSFSNLNL